MLFRSEVVFEIYTYGSGCLRINGEEVKRFRNTHGGRSLDYTLQSFDSNYSAFNDFQSRMDRYWSMRWIEQEGINELKATVVKGDLVRIEGLPMAQRVPGLPELPRGQSVLMKVLNLDYLSLVMECSLIKVLNESHEEDLEEEEIEVEVGTPEAVPPEEPQIEGVEPGNEGLP